MAIELDPAARTTVLVHYYRAMATRADIWRTRMDATTNWAIGSSAAIISFVLGDRDAPASALLIAAILTFVFLLLEARRLTFYHLWQRRVLLIERLLVRPAVAGATSLGPEAEAAQQELLDEHLGRTVPRMPLRKAVARRFRRVYLFLFVVQASAFALKQSPQTALSTGADEGWIDQLLGVDPPTWLIAAGSIAIGAAAAALWRMGGVDRGERS
jgi:uncharacterized membrane protein